MNIVYKIKEIYRYREMLRNLIRRDLRGRYKGTVLGFVWTFINPLLQLIVYSLVFSVFMRMGIDQYYIFLFVTLIPWMFFATSVLGGSTCILDNQNLVTKIYFPREVIPIAVVTSNFINMLYCFVVVFVVVIACCDNLNLVAWIYLPVIAFTEYIVVLGLVLIFSSLTVYCRDLTHILSVITMAWQFLTPVMYPLSIVPANYVDILNLNPMTPIIIAYRSVLYYGEVPDGGTLVNAILFGVFSLLAGSYIFNKLKRRFAEEL